MATKVILLEDVDKLGKTGETIQVKDGHARNFLLPQKMAMLATAENQRFFADRRKSLEKKTAAEKTKMEELARSLEGTPIVAHVQVGEEGKLFGSVTTGEIARLIKETKGLEIEKRKIELPEPIKSLGDFEIPIRLFADVTAKIKLSVVPLET